MRLQRGGNATRVLQGAQHKIFVEGSHDEEIDPVVIGELLRNHGLPQVEVRPMGGCDNVRSAAQALARHHPAYYFVIDRDVQDHATVERSWNNFPDPTTHNMLIWRKRELENYFIDPDYIKYSDFLTVSEADLKDRIIEECNRRLFLDAANLALAAVKQGVRGDFPRDFRDVGQFRTEPDGARQLDEYVALRQLKTSIDGCFSRTKIAEIYAGFVRELSGDIKPLEYGRGTWLERMSGKEVFRCIVGPCFRVSTRDRTLLQGREKNKQIAKKLLARPLTEQPLDFQKLFHLVKERVEATP